MECIQHKATPSNEDTNFFFLSLTYTIWQRRPGPALNLTLSEAKEATEKVGKLIIHSASHKTSTHITQLFLWSKEMIQNISSITFKISDQKYPHPPPWSVLQSQPNGNLSITTNQPKEKQEVCTYTRIHCCSMQPHPLYRGGGRVSLQAVMFVECKYSQDCSCPRCFI